MRAQMICLGLLAALLLLPAGVQAACGGGAWGVKYVPFPAPIPTPRGNLATGAYLSDRAHWGFPILPAPTTGLLGGWGDFIYLETNGVPDLQPGGNADVPPTPLTTNEYPECSTANPDELVVGILSLHVLG